MTIQFTCPSCGKGLRSPENLAGQSARCPQCGLVVSVPSPSSPPSPATPPSPAVPPSVPAPAPPPSSAEVPKPGFDFEEPPSDDDWSDEAADMPPLHSPVVSPAAAATRSAASGNTFLDFVLFRRMIAPVIIQIIFWLSVAGFLITGAISLIGGVGILLDGDVLWRLRLPAGLFGIISGLMTVVAGPLVARILSETFILFFRMNETLTDIRNRLESTSTA